MKKVLAMLLVLSMLLGCSAAIAEMGVQVIGGNNLNNQPVSLDDVQLEATVEVPGWGDVTPTAFEVWDCVMVRKPGMLGQIWCYQYDGNFRPDGYDKNYSFKLKIECANHAVEKYPWWSEDFVTHYESGTQADFAFLCMDILNTTTGKVNFLKECTVKVIFDDTVEYAGWSYQRDMDLNRCTWISNDNNFVIDPYYEGHYVFGCTLPNAVINSKKPLRMVIMIDGNEITYNIRK